MIAALASRDVQIARLTLNDYGRVEQVVRDLAQSSFDAVLFYEALENYRSPSESLLMTVELLRPGGFVLARSLKKLSDVFWRSGYSIQADEKVALDEDSACYILKAYVDDPYEATAVARTHVLAEAPSTASFDYVEANPRNPEPALSHLQLIANAQTAIEKAELASAELENFMTAAAQSERASEATLTNRIVDLEAQLLSIKANEACLQQAVEAERSLRLRLEAVLGIKEVALSRLAQTAAEYETAWSELYGELERSNLEHEEIASGLRASLDATRRERDATRERLTREVTNLKSQISEGGVYVSRLLGDIDEKAQELEAIRAASLADRATTQEYIADLRERSQELETTLRSQMTALTAREREMGERLAEFERSLGEENRELRQRVAEAERALATQTDAIVAKMQSESAQLSNLVDTVQSSRFWKFKRWLNRLRGRASGT